MPLLTLALTLDASGFVRHSDVFEGNLSQRLGRHKEKCRRVFGRYQIDLKIDEAIKSPRSTGNTNRIYQQRKPTRRLQTAQHPRRLGRRNPLANLYMLTDLESIFRSLKYELEMCPVYHHKKDRCGGHLFITVLAYQAVQVIRRKLKEHGINESWATLREKLARQYCIN